MIPTGRHDSSMGLPCNTGEEPQNLETRSLHRKAGTLAHSLLVGERDVGEKDREIFALKCKHMALEEIHLYIFLEQVSEVSKTCLVFCSPLIKLASVLQKAQTLQG